MRFRNHPSGIFRDQQTGALPESSAVDFQGSGKPLVKSLPCAKGGGTRQRDGGIVIQKMHKNNPSVSFADSSLYTREPFLASAPPSTSHSSLEDEDLGRAGLEESSAREEDLGELRLPQRDIGEPLVKSLPCVKGGGTR